MNPADTGPIIAEHNLPIIVKGTDGRLREGHAKHTLNVAEMTTSIKIRLDRLNLTYLPIQIATSVAIPILSALAQYEPIPHHPTDPWIVLANKGIEVGFGLCLGFILKKFNVRGDVARETHLSRKTITLIDKGWRVIKTDGRSYGVRRIRDRWL